MNIDVKRRGIKATPYFKNFVFFNLQELLVRKFLIQEMFENSKKFLNSTRCDGRNGRYDGRSGRCDGRNGRCDEKNGDSEGFLD